MEKTWNTGELTRSALWAKLTPKEHWGLIHKVTKESGMTSKEPKASFGSVKVRVHASTIGKRPGKNGLHGRRKPLMTKKITKPGLTYARKNILMRAFHKKKIISTASSCCQGWHSQLLGLWGLQVCDDPPHSTRAHVSASCLLWAGPLLLSLILWSNANLSMCFVPPPSTSTCTLAIFSSPWIPVCCASKLSRRIFHTRQDQAWPVSKSTLASQLCLCYFSFCSYEHLQAHRRSFSSGCYHHPATQNMEKQVVCRWALDIALI